MCTRTMYAEHTGVACEYTLTQQHITKRYKTQHNTTTRINAYRNTEAHNKQQRTIITHNDAHQIPI